MSKRRAIISVSDKRGVAEFAKALVDLDFEIVSIKNDVPVGPRFLVWSFCKYVVLDCL